MKDIRKAARTSETVKTTMVLPKDLWKAAKIRAVEEDADLNGVVIAALEAYVKVRAKRREEGA
ncbi:MAG: hypothetical protein HYY64_12225 [Candidatus Rokubacteria bacterium]|nr:hypothetical protein [Candidatus Rokubacteria bacterium]